MSLNHCFARNLRRYRQEKKFTQEELAKLSGVSETLINVAERERSNISLGNIEKIAKALDIDAYKLLYPQKTV